MLRSWVQWTLVVTTAVLVCNAHAQFRRGSSYLVEGPETQGQSGFVRSGPTNRVPPAGGFSDAKTMTVAVSTSPTATPPSEETGPQLESPKQEAPKDFPFQFQREYHPPALPFPRYNFGGQPFFNTFNRPGYIGGPSPFGYTHDFSFPSNPAQFNNFGYFSASPPQSYHFRREYDDHGCRNSQDDKDNKTPVVTTVTPIIPDPNFHQKYDIGPDGFTASQAKTQSQPQGQGSSLSESQEDRRPRFWGGRLYQ